MALNKSITLFSLSQYNSGYSFRIIILLDKLNKIGIRFSLDDFGTGYSSLQYLKRLPIDQLKIDQTFVRDIGTDINDSAIVNRIIAMAQPGDVVITLGAGDVNSLAPIIADGLQRRFA